MKSKSSLKRILGRLLRLVNRFAPAIECVLVFYCVDYVNRTQFEGEFLGVLLFALPIFLLYRLIKWEYICWQSRARVRDTCSNKRVQGFSGAQGCGKTSFMLFCLYTIKSPSIYTNFPCKIRGKYTNQLDFSILNMDRRIPEHSACAISEATMFFHNLINGPQGSRARSEAIVLYGQQLHQQIIRHAYDGNLFYDSVDLSRLPQMLKDNFGLTNYMLGQGSVTLSFLITPLLKLIAKPLGVDLRGSIRYWDVQQIEKIPEVGYTFDLSNQEKSVDDKHFANLYRIATWDSIYRFEYDDRFLRGLYAMLPEHISKAWKSLEFADDDLRDIGYGILLDFFNEKALSRR